MSMSGFPVVVVLNGLPSSIARPRKGLAVKAMGKAYSVLRGYRPRNQSDAFSECEFLLKMRLSQSPAQVPFLKKITLSSSRHMPIDEIGSAPSIATKMLEIFRSRI